MEIGNALWQKQRRGAITTEQAKTALPAARRWFPNLTPAAELYEVALDLAVALEHPIYDCAYLALAERYESRFVTADRRLHAAATAAGMDWVDKL